MFLRKRNKESGFTLIELMVANTIMIIVFATVISMFLVNKEKLDYESNKSVRLASLSFASAEILKSLRSKVSYPWTHPETLQAVSSSAATTQIAFLAYDPVNSIVAPYTSLRQIVFNNGELSYLRQVGGKSQRLMRNVTFFKVFDDAVTPRAGFTGIPSALPNRNITLPDGTTGVVHGYTVLIEVSIPTRTASKATLNKDVLGNDISGFEKRLWRYYQLYPESGNTF